MFLSKSLLAVRAREIILILFLVGRRRLACRSAVIIWSNFSCGRSVRSLSDSPIMAVGEAGRPAISWLSKVWLVAGWVVAVRGTTGQRGVMVGRSRWWLMVVMMNCSSGLLSSWGVESACC